MSSSLLRNPQTSLTLSCRQWLLHRCMHLSSQEPSTSETTALSDSKNESVGPRSPKPRKPTKKIKNVEETPPQNLVSLHLEKIRENPLKLEDIETQRPSEIPSPFSKDYEEKYRGVVDSLDRAFTVKQMQDFLETNNIALPRRKTKFGLASQILEQKWGWETLESVMQRKVDWSQVVEEQFPLDKVEAFLFMGKDGTGALQLSRRYESQVNFIVNPMSVKVTGLQGSVKKIGRYLESFKEDIEVENFALPSDCSLQLDTGIISRISGAYVKMINDSEVSISFLKSFPHAANLAKPLILQAATKDIDQCVRAIHLPKKSDVHGISPYSLFPFSPESTSISQKPSTTTFRYRRVGQNFMKSSVPIPSEGLQNAENFGTALTVDNSQYDIKNQLLSQIPVNDVSNSSLTFTASSGQFLFISPSNQSTLLPPIPGEVHPDAIFRWIDDKPSQVTFHPSASLEILSAPAHEVQNVRRLIYRTVNPSRIRDSDHIAERPISQRTIELEIPLPESTVETADEFPTLQPLENASCIKYTEQHLDLLIPERQGDLRISALHTQTIPSDTWPEELKCIELVPMAGLENTEDNIPLMFKLADETYFLHRDDHVERSFKTITQQGSKTTNYNVILETSTDYATGNKETSCKTVCQDYGTTSGWNDFLKTWSCLASPRSQRTAPDPYKPTSFF